MAITLICCLFSCVGLLVSVLFKPNITIKKRTVSIYWLPAVIGSLFLLVSGTLPFEEGIVGLTASGMNPLKILSLFISITFLSVFLDEVGFFRKVANLLLKKAKGSQKKLFVSLYLIVSILTVFTSNDVVVLTFTPFICCFCKEEKISPLPYLVAEFFAANTWSMMLVIGNPTNIYLAGVCGINFFEYLSVMWLPTLLSGVATFLLLLAIFRKQLSTPIAPVFGEAEIWDRGLLVLGVLHLAGAVVCLAISSYLPIPMWLFAVGFACSLFVCTMLYSLLKRKWNRGTFLLGVSLRRAPWSLVPFVLSMFLIVLSLEKYGVTGKIASFLGGRYAFINYGAVSFLVSNLINNIPMSVLFGGVLQGATAPCVYATIIGSNLGACLTPIGALAGIMWTGLLKRYKLSFSFLDFIKYGCIAALPSLAFALFGLFVIV